MLTPAAAVPQFWFPHAPEGYALGEVLHHDADSDNMQVKLHISATETKVRCPRAHGHCPRAWGGRA